LDFILTEGQADALGNPLDFILTEGQAGDNPQAQALLKGKKSRHVLADRAYDADATLAYISDMGAMAVIPPNPLRLHQRQCDWWHYKERHLVECFIGKLKYFRRVFSRYDKLAKRFLAFIYFASTFIWIK
jgi:transposase